jgi:hypothetical protein
VVAERELELAGQARRKRHRHVDDDGARAPEMETGTLHTPESNAARAVLHRPPGYRGSSSGMTRIDVIWSSRALKIGATGDDTPSWRA